MSSETDNPVKAAFFAAVNSVNGIELFDMDTLSFKVAPVSGTLEINCRFAEKFDFLLKTDDYDSFTATLREGKVSGSAYFSIGYNPETQKPQIGWSEGVVPEDLWGGALRASIDIMVALAVALLQFTGNDPAEHFPRFHIKH